MPCLLPFIKMQCIKKGEISWFNLPYDLWRSDWGRGGQSCRNADGRRAWKTQWKDSVLYDRTFQCNKCNSLTLIQTIWILPVTQSAILFYLLLSSAFSLLLFFAYHGYPVLPYAELHYTFFHLLWQSSSASPPPHLLPYSYFLLHSLFMLIFPVHCLTGALVLLPTWNDAKLSLFEAILTHFNWNHHTSNFIPSSSPNNYFWERKFLSEGKKCSPVHVCL